MGKKLNYKKRLNILLLLYSFIFTSVVLALGFFFINKIDKPKDEINKYFIKYSSEEFEKDLINGSLAIKIDELPTKVINMEQFQLDYNRRVVVNGIAIMITVFLLVLIMSILISKFISKKLIKPIEEMTTLLPDIISGNKSSIEEIVFIEELSGVETAINKSSEKIKKLLNEANSINSYISHEQKNTLALLRAKIQLGEKEELLALVDKMSNSLDDILALNSIENFKGEEEEVDLTLVVAEAIDIYSKVYKDIEFEIDEDNIPTIKGRKLWIYRAVCNLIENAIKYGDNSKITVSVYNKNGSSIISVEDRGNGIDKELVDKIFNYKYRGENLKKDGYGIGLSLVNQITKLCGGVVFVDSEHGKGSKFYMAFKTLTLD